MDPRRGAGFIKRISAEAEFRTRFSGYYSSISAVLVRLGAPEPKPSIFFLDKVERLQQALKTEEKLLESACHEVTARETGLSTSGLLWIKHVLGSGTLCLDTSPGSRHFLHGRLHAGRGKGPGLSTPAPPRGSAGRGNGLPVAPQLG